MRFVVSLPIASLDDWPNCPQCGVSLGLWTHTPQGTLWECPTHGKMKLKIPEAK